MKIIELGGVTNLEPIQGTNEWFYNTDYIHGDLYEAEELYRKGHDIQCNSLGLIHYPDGKVYRPIKATKGQYFGKPIYDAGSIILLVVNFLKEKIRIVRFSLEKTELEEVVSIPLSSTANCYNLMIHSSPVTLTRQPNDGTIEIIWPEQKRFSIGFHESLNFRDGEKLYFTEWQEDSEQYWDKTIVRTIKDGHVVESYQGDIRIMPNGEKWLVK